ncbi:MAG: antibiotic biosynthesis monooxygenase [Pyrinomonadaceae bacterium]|nr:antibiotic biosynthesis monooxygenase [Pyrinomonadaceae bacterium]
MLNYVHHRRQEAHREFVLYEQWRDRTSLDNHLARLQTMLGAPAPGEMLHASLLDMRDKTQIVFYDVVF